MDEAFLAAGAFALGAVALGAEDLLAALAAAVGLAVLGIAAGFAFAAAAGFAADFLDGLLGDFATALPFTNGGAATHSSFEHGTVGAPVSIDALNGLV